jgi:mannitol-specific phosphotransferase system IIBC component
LRWNTRDPANVALINTEKVDEDISACMSLRGAYPLIKEEKKKEEVVIIVEEDEKKKKMKKVKKEKREEEEVKPTIMKRSRSPVSSTTTSRPEWIRIDKLPNYRELSWCTPVISEAIIKLVVVVNAGGAVREEKEIKLKGKTKRDGVTVWQVLCTVMNNIPRLGKNEL